MCTYFKTDTEDHSIGRILSQKRHGGMGLVSEKTEDLYAERVERVEAATSSYSATGKFLQYIYSVLVAKNHQKIRVRCLVHELFPSQIILTILIMVTEQLY